MSDRVPFRVVRRECVPRRLKRFDIQDLWNWFVERAGSPYAKSGQALLPCPGFAPFATLPKRDVRGLFAQNQNAWAVGGDTLYELTPTGA